MQGLTSEFIWCCFNFNMDKACFAWKGVSSISPHFHMERNGMENKNIKG
jgi:hypothetical protein